MKSSLKLSSWLDSCQAPSVLMIDDLSDAYVDKYREPYKNDWGYLTDQTGGCFDYISKNLLSKYPHIKISFFVPYLRHNVIKDSSNVIKYDIADREEFISFLNQLVQLGHEVCCHGSNHGMYIDGKWFQEWDLFESQDEANTMVKKAKEYFYNNFDFRISGGKYCGYKYNEYSDVSIAFGDFKYWCKDARLDLKSDIKENDNGFLEFPTNIAGNVFVKYLYKKEVIWKDILSKILFPLQYFKNRKSTRELRCAITLGKIISIQEHYSPSTTRGLVQSCNVISDIESLQRIYSILSDYDIWYATCEEVTDYYSLRESSSIVVSHDNINVRVGSQSVVKEALTIESNCKFKLISEFGEEFVAIYKDSRFFITIVVSSGDNNYTLIK
ncbi:hypothetical protein AB4391_20905 [Vibrio lentus]|uniref:Polysaccharide deacetylase n=1 Tax=Vibrio lentus TaxID=136468 RepID=A0A2N7JUD4_9VIBR|nr:hypothetical protein [Vibrio lentus]PMM62535.1 hypothetical protein BCT49_18630 [Vibrio lentus]